MSKIDYQALREAAEKATPGNWWIDSHGQAMVSFIDNEVLEVFSTDNKRDAVRHEDTGNLSRWRNDNDATFIAKANPATVLALLDELDKWQQESSAWQSVAEKQLALATNAEQKVSELEALTAPRLPQPAPVSVPAERAAFETFMEKRFKDLIDRRLLKNGDGEYFAWDMQVAWIAWQERAAMLKCSEPVTDNTNQQFESLSRGNK